MSLHAWSDYVRASESAGVTVRNLRPQECVTAAAILTELWGGSPMGAPLLVAMEHAGTYVAGAFRADELIGVCAGFFGPPDARSMHSHVAGVKGGRASKGVGTAMKLHQRAWCLDHGVAEMTWTFDPLVARNAAFNVRRLGASLDEYLVDFYGQMTDGVNTGQGSDRILVRWHLDSLIPRQPREPGDAPLVLSVGADYRPVAMRAPEGADAVAIVVPSDVESLRARDGALAAEWRLALREAMAPRWDEGWRPVAVGRDGRYLMEKR
ncbi:hypothetical protein [Demequina lutea]|uniref:Putative GNAT superfamily acetyltransferase n=1 Tax=Demequina lutea TaxID=431489 RepID=A0A7Y9ZDZ6_9MICO|nr:hypothetical protein [Demequina lutea]NYI41636.1 putative GNAT superfamily acetyltransferase [Demequina lutea]